MNPVVHFEIPANEMEKTRVFYEKVFNWKVNTWSEEYFLTTTTPVDG